MPELFKVVRVDNFNRETVAEKLEEENLTDVAAECLCERLREESIHRYGKGGGEFWWMVYPQSHRLWRGMEDLV